VLDPGESLQGSQQMDSCTEEESQLIEGEAHYGPPPSTEMRTICIKSPLDQDP
jgi:hypothetical protein